MNIKIIFLFKTQNINTPHEKFYSFIPIITETTNTQGCIQAILMSVRWQKKLNFLNEFSHSIFIKFYFKAYWHRTCIQNKLAY